jgi:hypothetical protein
MPSSYESKQASLYLSPDHSQAVIVLPEIGSGVLQYQREYEVKLIAQGRGTECV